MDKTEIIEHVQSICPECGTGLRAGLYERDGSVWMGKSCREHGFFEDLIYSDAALFRQIRKWDRDFGGGIKNPPAGDSSGCPDSCGLCSSHRSTAALTIIDLTNRCNLNCPYCFAGAGRNGLYEPALDEIEKMLELSCSVKPERRQGLQFSGGEPTVAPLFIDAVKLAAGYGYLRVMAATNGIRFGESEEFTRKAGKAGLKGVYLQFDGTGEEIWRRTRSKNLLELKFRAVENCRKAGIDVTLVPTVIKGVNDKQIGDIIRYALENVDTVSGVAFQPVAVTGRANYEKRKEIRFTLSDMAREVGCQTGLTELYRDWYPINTTSLISEIIDRFNPGGHKNLRCSCHYLCGLGTYLLVNTETGETVPVTAILDMERLLPALDRIIEGGRTSRILMTAKLAKEIKKAYRKENAPEGLGVGSLIKAADALSGGRLTGTSDKKRYKWRIIMIGGMHFMDSYNFMTDRVRNCVVQYAAPDGRMYPFCTYNAGPFYRYNVEKRYLKDSAGEAIFLKRPAR